MTLRANNPKVTAVSLYPSQIASTRLRVDPLRDPLAELGMDFHRWTFISNVDVNEWLRGGLSRVRPALRSVRNFRSGLNAARDCSLLVVQREALPLNSLAIEKAAVKDGAHLVWDIDDAIWESHRGVVAALRGSKRKYRWLARHAAEVWAGNNTVAQWAVDAGARFVIVIPTTVASPAHIDNSRRESDLLIWIGTQSTVSFLEELLPRIAPSLADWRLHVVGARLEVPKGLRATQVPWTQEAELDALQRGAVGLYPLDSDHPMTEGKSALKSILVRSFGVPVIATRTKSTEAVMGVDEGGFFASTEDEWGEALGRLRNSETRDLLSSQGLEATRKRFGRDQWMRSSANRLLNLVEGRQGASHPYLSPTPKLASPPLVSVIIPIHNAERWIAETLSSIDQQTYPNWELIAVDDGSSDSSADIVRAFAATSVHSVTLIQTDNQGGASARNCGINAASGELLAFIDSDDLWKPDKLQLQVQIMIDDQSALACGSSYEFFSDKTGKITGYVGVNWSPRMVRRWFFLEGYGAALNSTLMIRRQVIEAIGCYDDQFRFGEDADLGWRLSKIGTIRSTPIPLTQYRIWDGQVHSDPEALRANATKIFAKHLAARKDLHAQALANMEFVLGLRYFGRHQWRTSIACFWRSASLYPVQPLVMAANVLQRRLSRKRKFKHPLMSPTPRAR
jgi:glycosyltransferase involved in cell wall biosynthesis